ncbi:MAG: hypothetical protein K2K23_05900, partial [Muribaculaceae bacterium]|nr:hypothetical protein [Muribaculaceae bacterium]
HEVLPYIKDKLRDRGAVYASMSGSGSTVFGLFRSKEAAEEASMAFGGHYVGICML